MYNTLTINPNSSEMTRNCTRFPPTSHAVPTQQGLAMICSYPVIKNDMQACGEWDDGKDIVIETVPRTMSN
jgi:hypothetical protein